MFLKPIKIKSTSQIKSSDRKRLRSDISKCFPSFNQEQLSNLVPSKEDMQVMKVASHSGIHAMVYCLQKVPIFYEIDKAYYPTVYTLWTHPKLLPTFNTWPDVLDKLCSGADLMLPGVVLDNTTEYGPQSYGELAKGQPCAVCIVGNDAPVAVGHTALSSQDMFESGKRGKAVIIQHVYRDQLWAVGEKGDLPVIKPAKQLEMCSVDSDGRVTDVAKDLKLDAEQCLQSARTDDGDELEAMRDDKSPVELMDELLSNCFLSALKSVGKKLELPVLTSTFYRTHMLRFCPKDSVLDVKKSSFKKLSKFLKEMEAKKMLIVKELSKGVESITSIDLSHEDVRRHKIGESLNRNDEEGESDAKSRYEPPDVTEMYSITMQVLPIFKNQGYSKSNMVDASEVRRLITVYVKENELQDPDNKRIVKLDPCLTDAALNKSEYNIVENLTWEELSTRILSRMQPCHRLCFAGQKPIYKKGKLEMIDLSIAQRSGNKKVTLIHNLDAYGIDAVEFAHKIQIGVAASTSVNPSPPNRKAGSQVLVQGNQVNFIGNLLVDDYGLPKKYVHGLDKGIKNKRN
ncbi:EIF2D (predicted) [Pycnogonum litorale]